MSALRTKRERDRREQALVLELQRDYGWAFALMPRKAERTTTLWSRGGAKVTLTGAYRAAVCIPLSSPIAKAFGKAEEKPAKARGKR